MASSSVYSSLANSSYSYFRILAEASASESGTSVSNNTSTVSYTVKATFKPTNGHSFAGTSRPNAGYVDVLIGGNVVKTIITLYNDNYLFNNIWTTIYETLIYFNPLEWKTNQYVYGTINPSSFLPIEEVGKYVEQFKSENS